MKIFNKIITKLLAPQLGVLGNNKYAKQLLISFSKNYLKSLKTLIDYPAISIVTPSYQQAKFIESTIRSVLDQNYPRLEYIIIDGGSKDGTVDILKKYETSLTRWISENDEGQSHALNKGFKYSNGEILAYLNSDDILLPGSLEYVARFFKNNPLIDAVYGHRILINSNGLEIGRWFLPYHSDKIIRLIDYVPQETLFWRKSAWDKVGGFFDESFHYAMDWDFITRLLDAGSTFARMDAFIGAFRVYPSQKTTANHDIGKVEIDKIRKKHFGYIPTYDEIKIIKRLYMLKSRLLEFQWKYCFKHFDIE